VYEAPDGAVRVDVRLERHTVWLTVAQIAELFGRSRQVIYSHLSNVYSSGELEREPTVSKNETVQMEGRRQVAREVEFYNLDAILSVGYRVNSKRGTQFRIWATGTLRDHLLRGYSLNERRLAEQGIDDLQQAVGLLAKTLQNRELVTEEGRSVLQVVECYTRTWRLLLEFDQGRLATAPSRPVAPGAWLGLMEARTAVSSIRGNLAERGEASALFGLERGAALEGSLGAVEQTFDGAPLYPSAQSRAAHLLYFVIKDHPFADGNKRIGALLFLEYLRRHDLLWRPNGQPRLADNAVVAVALLIAESAPAQKELMVRLVMSLLEDGQSG
jgi:prophage maintenance system killer protein